MANEFKVKKGLIVDGVNTVLDIQGTSWAVIFRNRQLNW